MTLGEGGEGLEGGGKGKLHLGYSCCVVVMSLLHRCNICERGLIRVAVDDTPEAWKLGNKPEVWKLAHKPDLCMLQVGDTCAAG